MPNHLTESALHDFFSEADEIIGRATSALTTLESQGHSHQIIDSLYRDIHTLKGSAQLFGFTGIGLTAHALESSFEPIRSERAQLTKELVTSAFKALDLIDKMLKNTGLAKVDGPLASPIANAIGAVAQIIIGQFQGNCNLKFFSTFKTEFIEGLENALDSLKKSDQNPPVTTQAISIELPVDLSPVTLPSHPKTAETSDPKEMPNGESSTIRIQVTLLDRLMNLIGELVLIRNQAGQFSEKQENYDFANMSQRLDLVTSELQENVMKTRLQPIGTILSKFQRVVRDIAQDLNKHIELVIKGADTELDRSLLEAIRDPLIHLIRNSCDHGIEPPIERAQKGKPERGTITLNAIQEGGQVIIEISDDGQGLNLSKILAKAIDKQLLSADRARQLSEKDIANLIFLPGFSTAEHVSSLSGRGVGMDVVKTNIERIGGQVDITTVLGKGMRIRLRIPLTLAIVPAMLLNSGGETFAIPQIKLQELVLVDQEGSGPKIEILQGQPIFRLRGNLLPLTFINANLNLSKSTTETLPNLSQGLFNIVVLSNDSSSFGLIVDEILDTADIVVKPLPRFLKSLNMYSGATIMGDGSVALILDIAGLAHRAKIHAIRSTVSVPNQQIQQQNLSSTQETQEMLYFSLNQAGRFCIPLALVQRLEEFPKDKIRKHGEDSVVQYRNSILPIIDLNRVISFSALNEGKSENNDKNPTPDSSTVSVIVIQKRRRFFGIQVEKIEDVLTVHPEITTPLRKTTGILGTLLNGDQIANVVDIFGLIDTLIDGPLAAPTALPQHSSSSPTINLKGVQILLAEDSPFFRSQILRILESTGAQVTVAFDGAIALNTLKSSPPDHFQLVISDIEMPNMTGFELISEIRKRPEWKSLPAFAITTRYSEEDLKKGMVLGFNQYLEKLNPNELLTAIGQQFKGMSA